MSRPATSQLVLSIETTAPHPGAAVAARRAGAIDVVAARHVEPLRGRGEALAGVVARVLEEAGIGVEDLDAICVVDGPGSYTGLRVGLALARGMALVDRLPTIAIGSLELVAHAGLEENVACEEICALLDASGGKLYASRYRTVGGVLECVRAAEVVLADELAATLEATGDRWTVCGDAALAETVDLDVRVSPERAGLLARIGAARLAAGAAVAHDSVLPRYVGATGARANRRKVAPTSALIR